MNLDFSDGFTQEVNDRFNGTLRREVLNAEWFTSIKQAQVVIETWLKQHNHIRLIRH